MENELITYLREMEERIRGEVAMLREDTAKGFKEVKEDIRLAHVSVEDLRGDVRLVAEGVANANERLDRYREEVARQFKEVETRQRLAYQDLKGRLETQ